MAQYEDEGQVESTKFDLQQHLSKYNAPTTLYKLLCYESITVDELLTFTTNDLEDWCNEHNLKTIERRRFINAVKKLPNYGQRVNNDETQAKTEVVFLGHEEKEKLNQFYEMENNVSKFIDLVHDIQTKSSIENGIKQINCVCDQIQAFVANLRKNLIRQAN